MVGTSPTVRPVARARWSSSRHSAAVSTTRTVQTAAGTTGATAAEEVETADSASCVVASCVARAAPAW